MLRSRTINLANPVNRKHPLNIGRVAWYLALPGLMGGAKWHDLMSPPDLRVGNHGTLTNIVQGPTSGWQGTNRPGGWGNVRCDGTDDYATFPSIAYASGPWSILMWVRMAGSLSGYVSIAGARHDSNTTVEGPFFIHANRGDTNFFDFQWSGGTNASGNSASSGIHWPDEKWHQVGGSVSSTSVSLFFDGQILSAVSRTAAFVTDTGATYLGAGYYNGNPVDFHSLEIDGCSIWNRVLGANDVFGAYEEDRRGNPNTLRRLSFPYRSGVSPFYFNRYINKGAT